MRKNSPIGGQAVMEGVMMRNSKTGIMAVAVRKPDGSIAMSREEQGTELPWYRRVVFVRGVVNFVMMLVSGMKTLSRSFELGGFDDEDTKPSRFEKWLSDKTGKDSTDIAIGVGLVLGAVLAVGLFVLLPQFVVSLLGKAVKLTSFTMALAEGVLRLVIFLGYMLLVSLIKDIRRFFAYHGAEHKTINCYEAGLPLSVENVMAQSTRHPRCGTSFLLIVMVISILVFALTGLFVETGSNMLARIGLRLLLLPVVASLSYECLMALAKHENRFTAMLRAPGMALQALTTRESDPGMCEVAIAAFAACLDTEERARVVPQEDTAETPDGE